MRKHNKIIVEIDMLLLLIYLVDTILNGLSIIDFCVSGLLYLKSKLEMYLRNKISRGIFSFELKRLINVAVGLLSSNFHGSETAINKGIR